LITKIKNKMAKKVKRDKYLLRSLEIMGFELSDSADFSLDTERDLDALISETKYYISDTEASIQEIAEGLENGKKFLETLISIKKQMLVEEYKDLNPNVEIFSV